MKPTIKKNGLIVTKKYLTRDEVERIIYTIKLNLIEENDLLNESSFELVETEKGYIELYCSWPYDGGYKKLEIGFIKLCDGSYVEMEGMYD